MRQVDESFGITTTIGCWVIVNEEKFSLKYG
jgi:hypothetical protein